MTQVQCTHCNAKLGIKTHVAGQPITCPKCRQAFTPGGDIEPLPEANAFSNLTDASPPPIRRRFFQRNGNPASGWGWSAGSALFGLCGLLTLLAYSLQSSIVSLSRNGSGAIEWMGGTALMSGMGCLWGIIGGARESNGLALAGFLLNLALLLVSGLLFVGAVYSLMNQGRIN